MNGNSLDDLDRQLIDLLARDARVSNRKIAAELGVTEGTVRGRIKRLQQDGLIRFTAITGMDMASKVRMAFVWVQAEVDKTRAIARTIAAMPEISAVLITMGRFNILAISMFEDLEELSTIASDQILPMKGVHHVETSIVVRTMKYNALVAKITDPPCAENGEGP